MRILALDYGAARIGCALSDPTGTLATPLAAIGPPDGEEVARLARRHEVERIVVGMPVTLAGERGDQARATQDFCDRLAGLVEVEVETYDERFTTRMAARTRRDAGSGADEDSIAAAHLLESYLLALESRRSRGEDGAQGGAGGAGEGAG